MKSFYSIVQSRRSTRKYSAESIPKEIIEQLQHIALMSPASKRSNPWEFIFVTDTQLLEQLSQAKPHGASFVKDAPLSVVVIADPSKSDVWVEDTSIASIYLQLAAEDFGLGSCWVQIHKRFHVSGILASDYIKQLLQIPSEYEVESIISIGYKAEGKQPFDLQKALYNRIHYNTFKTI